VLYDDLPAAKKKCWHLRIGEALEPASARRRSRQRRARAPLFIALPHGEMTKAVAYANTAAVEAARFFAFADAYQLLEASSPSYSGRGATRFTLIVQLLTKFILCREALERPSIFGLFEASG